MSSGGIAIFGMPANFTPHNFTANYQGPLIPLKAHSATALDLVATHQDPNATLGLVGSAQKVALDMSVLPNKVSGEASFFSADGQDILHCTFAGSIPDSGPGANEPRKAFVHAVFTGGTGRFQHAIGTGIVEAELFPSRGFSSGRIVGDILLPNDS